MLNNLKAEYVRKGIAPYQGIMNAIDCSERTARNKLSGKCQITVAEAIKIKKANFSEDPFGMEYLFATE